ncbi:hypothetical protein LEA_17248, partial [human gut metagenome]
IDKIMDKYDKGAMLVGEGPLTKRFDQHYRYRL